MLTVGDSVDRYVIEAVLGEGGMGRVFRALDPRLGRRVALKVLLAEGDAAGRSEAAARMVREARAAAAFSHPNVVAIYDVGEVDGAPYIAMELVSGQTLRVASGEGLGASDAQKIRWLADVARGLAAAHRAGLVHRDIKPDNVMVTSDGVVKILDFGIARHADSDGSLVDDSGPTAAAQLPAITAEGHMIGTPAYMAPEQLRGERLDGRCDEFSWGVMAWELLARRSPWGNPTNPAVLVTAVLATAARPLREVAPGVPPAVSEVVEKALAKDRSERFATMDEVVAALERVDATRDSSRAPMPDPAAPAALDAAIAMAPTVAAPSPPSGAGGGRAEPARTGAAARLPRVRLVAVLVLLAGAGAWALAARWHLAPAIEVKATASREEEPASPDASAEGDNLFPCRDTQRALAPARDACREETVAWCATDGEQVACCPPEMVARSRDGACQCPPGGLPADSTLKKCPRSAVHVGGDGTGRLSPEAMREVIRRDFGKIRLCYEAALARNAEEGGRFAVHFEIGPDGRVFFARIQDSTLTDPGEQECMLERFRALRFPPPVGGVVTATYPIVFDARDD